MWMMHTKLPEFIKKMKVAAATKGKIAKKCEVVGLENYKTAKMQSLRTGKIEQSVAKLANMDDVDSIEVAIMNRVPESMHQAVIRGFDKNGKPIHAVLETINILHETEEILIHECIDIQDNRSPIGKH
jgi:hypothetical protein